MGFGREIKDFIAAMSAGQRMVSSAGDGEYKRLRQQLLKTQIDKANDPETLKLQKDVLRARANRLNSGRDPELTEGRRLNNELRRLQIEQYKNPPQPDPGAAGAVPDDYGTPPSRKTIKPDKVSALDLEDDYEDDELTQFAGRGGVISDVRKVKAYADGGAVESREMRSAKRDLARRMKDRQEEQEDDSQPLQFRDALAATRDAAARGDYDAEGRYKPFNPRRHYADGGAVEEDDDIEDDFEADALDQEDAAEDDEEAVPTSITSQGNTPTRGYSVQAAHDAVQDGLKFAKTATQGDDSGEDNPREALEVSAQSRQRRPGGVRNYLRGAGAASPDEVAAVRKAIDPQGKMSESEVTMASLAHVYEWKLRQGDPQGAARAAASLIQYHRQVASRYQALAKVAAENGDVDGTVKAMLKAHANIPDGKDLKVTKTQDGKLAYSMVDSQTGKVVEQNIATPDEVLAFASRGGIQSFDEFLQRTGNAPAAQKPEDPEIARGRKLRNDLTEHQLQEKKQGRGRGSGTPRLSDVKTAGEMVDNSSPDHANEYKLDKDSVGPAKDVASGLVRANPGDISPRDAMSIVASAFDPSQNLPAVRLEDGSALIRLPDKREIKVPASAYLQIQAQRGKRAATKQADDERAAAEQAASQERMKRGMDRQQPYLENPVPPGGKTYTDRARQQALPVLR